MFLRPESDLGWIPTHVQVTILQARGLRAKGKHGTSDAFTLIQVGREKYSTSVVEKTPGSPEWKEECSFELSPGALERGENCELQLTVMHRALIGMDQFLGKVGIPLQNVFQEGRSKRDQWYKLHSKSGKKEKERGEIQVSIQFTRNNLTASMFDLSIKDKPKTPFGKLKDKLKVKKLSQMESSSAIVPSSIGRLDSDEEDEKKPKSKAAAFFKGRLRKSSLTRSNTSLGSDSTISATSATIPTSAGISIVLPDVVKKPASRNSSLSTEPTVKDHEASPRMTHKRAFSDEVGQLKLFPEPKSVQNLKPKGSPISKSSVCINGSHVYTEVPAPKPIPPLEKSSPASRSFQNIVKKTEEATEVIRGPSQSPAKVEPKPPSPTVTTVEEQNASPKPKPRSDPARAETKPVQVTTPMVFTEDVSKNKSQEVKAKEEKSKVGHYHGAGKNDAAEPKPHAPTPSEERGKVGSWFASKDTKDSQQKPSFPSGSIATSEAAERGSSLVEEHSPFASRCAAEDLNVYPYQGQSGNLEAVDGRPEFRLTQSSSSGPPVVSGWEEQFDALASSRLQPSSSSDSEKYPSDKEGTMTSYDNYDVMFISPHDGDEWHHLHSTNSNLEICWPEKSSELPTLPTSLLPNFSPTPLPSLGSTCVTNAFKGQNTSNHASHRVDMPVLASSENRVATVQPLLLTEQKVASIGEVARKDSPIQTKESAAIGDRAVVESGTGVHKTQVSKESAEQVSTEHNPERIRVEHEVMLNEKVGRIIKEHAISDHVGSVAPPKPPRLMIETEDYNYEQTSHKDTSGKQTENPEVRLQEQNMGVGKLSVSPVARCPVIEIRSPVLGAFAKDTQSTTEGLLTNLRPENNDFSKLGAINGEHLLDVNEATATEQFRTCPSSVSLDTDLSSLHEGSDKLELMSRGQSKPLNATLGDGKKSRDHVNFQKTMPLSKIQIGSKSELSSLSKKGDQSDFVFWSALEEQIPSMGLDTKPTSQSDRAPSDGRNVGNLNSQQRPEPKHIIKDDALVLQRAQSASPPPTPLAHESDAKGNDGQRGYSLSQHSSWSADIIVDFKNEDFWRTDSDRLDPNHEQSPCASPGNPFTPTEKTPLSHKNPFIIEHSPSSPSSGSSLQENSSFKDLHARAALPSTDVKAPSPHGSQPLAFSTPSLAPAPNPKPSTFPSPIMLLTTPGATTTTNTHTATLSGLHSPVAGGVTTTAPAILPLETQTADNPCMPLKTSPHPVKPISATLSEPTPEKKTHRPAITATLSSGLEMLKSVTGGQSGTTKKQERLKDLGLPDQAAKYYHLTHDELIQMLFQREAELSRKENHIQELENYIDKLLVRIMEQAPALLQAPLETKE